MHTHASTASTTWQMVHVTRWIIRTALCRPVRLGLYELATVCKTLEAYSVSIHPLCQPPYLVQFGSHQLPVAWSHVLASFTSDRSHTFVSDLSWPPYVSVKVHCPANKHSQPVARIKLPVPRSRLQVFRFILKLWPPTQLPKFPWACQRDLRYPHITQTSSRSCSWSSY